MPVRYELNEYANDGSLLRTTHFVPIGPVDIEVDSEEHEIEDFYGTTVRRVHKEYTLRITAAISSIKRDAYTCTCAADPSTLCTMHRRSIL
jgi:hypothetical protein